MVLFTRYKNNYDNWTRNEGDMQKKQWRLMKLVLWATVTHAQPPGLASLYSSSSSSSSSSVPPLPLSPSEPFSSLLSLSSACSGIHHWDPRGVFFIYFMDEIGISDHKGMNLGWIFIYLFLSIKKDDISRYVFHMFAGCEFMAKNGWIFEACFSYVYGVWIYSKKWLNFEVCFSYVYVGVNLWQRMVEF